MHAFLTASPIQAILMELSTPGAPAMKNKADLQERTQSLLLGESRSDLLKTQKGQDFIILSKTP